MNRCPKCKKRTMRQIVSVFVDAPADCRSLSKKGIRSKDVFIHGVGWDSAHFYCGSCGFTLRLGKGRTP